MVVQIKMDTTQFFSNMLGGQSKAVFDDLVAKGVKPEIGFYSVSLGHPSNPQKNLTVNLPISSSTLLKGNATPEAAKASTKLLEQLLASAAAQWFGDSPIEGDQDLAALVSTKSKSGAAKAVKKPSKETVQSIAKAIGTVEVDYQVAEAKTSELVEPGPGKTSINDIEKLRLATSLGQKVRGTSPSSIYRVVALSPRVKVAVCIQQPNNVSVRIEGQPNAYEQGKITGLGFSKNAGPDFTYWSMHMDTSGLTPARCIGAILMDLGVSFDEQAKNLKEVQLEG